MIVAIDVTTLRGRISGVGYYTARIVEHLARSHGSGVSELLLLSNGSIDRALPEPARLYLNWTGVVGKPWIDTSRIDYRLPSSGFFTVRRHSSLYTL